MNRRLDKTEYIPKSIPKGIKWDHYRELMKYRKLQEALPETMKLNKQTCFRMLLKHKTVFIKPNQGAFGKGVMKVQRFVHEKKVYYRVHSGMVRKVFQTKEDLCRFICSHKKKEDYLVQQGIDLLRWHNRPFDLRLMMRRQHGGKWHNEGFVGRVAKPGKIVTNIRSGGTALSIEDLIRPHVNDPGRRKTITVLNQLGRSVSEKLERLYPGIFLFGIDIGLDQKMKPWIIEVNTRPEKICWKCMRKLYQKNKSQSQK
jgi:DNA-directed RNA polymerase subunit N (RpoN/RPB10)